MERAASGGTRQDAGQGLAGDMGLQPTRRMAAMSNAERRKQIIRDVEKAREILTAMAERRPTRELAERAATCLGHAHQEAKSMVTMLPSEDNAAGG